MNKFTKLLCVANCKAAKDIHAQNNIYNIATKDAAWLELGIRQATFLGKVEVLESWPLLRLRQSAKEAGKCQIFAEL